MPTTPAPVKSSEWLLAAGITALFVCLGLHCLGNLAFFGQDFTHHAVCVKQLQQDPWRLFSQDFTNRPAVYWIACLGSWLSDGGATYPLASLFLLLLNAGALLLFFDCTRYVLCSTQLRLSALAAAALMPVTVISSVVFAADATVLLPFMGMIWALLRSLHAPTPASSRAYAGLAGFALCAGMFCRFNFLLLPPVLAVLPFLLRWLGGPQAPWPALPGLGRRWLLAVCLPAFLLGLGLQILNTLQVHTAPDRHRFTPTEPENMTWSSLFLPKSADLDLLQAPGYFDPPAELRPSLEYIPIKLVGYPCLLLEDCPLPLLTANRYSYPMLLHLGLFTDVMDLANKGWTDRGAPRPQPQADFARWSVRSGLVFYLLAQAGWLVLLLRLSRVKGRRDWNTPEFVVCALPALAWFLSCTLVLPFLTHAYDWGYWLPRLILPFVLASVLLAFWLLDQGARSRPWLKSVAALAVAAQSTLHWLSLWY